MVGISLNWALSVLSIPSGGGGGKAGIEVLDTLAVTPEVVGMVAEERNDWFTVLTMLV